MFQTIVDWEAKTTRDMPSRNSLSQSYNRSFTDNFNALASYSKDINDHSVSLLAGYEFIKYQYEKFGASRTDFILQDYQVLDAGIRGKRFPIMVQRRKTAWYLILQGQTIPLKTVI